MVTSRTVAALPCLIALLVVPVPAPAQGLLAQMEDEVASIVGSARPAIVSIADERYFGGGQRSQPNEGPTVPHPPGTEHDHQGPPEGFPRRRMGEPPKIGSGFSIGDGFIVTTADVLAGMKSPIVTTDDGRHIRATVSGIDAEMNIGVLKLSSATKLPALHLGQSSRVYPGHFAISIGNQNGHLNSVALTLVAGIRDDGIPAGEHFYPGLIQIAGTIGAGMSGAPILNAHGDVIGMIAAIPFGDWAASPFISMPIIPGQGAFPAPPKGNVHGVVDNGAPPGSAKASGPAPGKPAGAPGAANDGQIVFMRPPVTSAGLALPIDDMKPVLNNLRQNKNVHCWLGLDMQDERKRAESDGVTTWKRTVWVQTIYPNSPAAASGLQPGDILISVNGKPLSRLTIIKAALLRAQPGDGMEFRIDRKGTQQTINVRLAARPEQPAAPWKPIQPRTP